MRARTWSAIIKLLRDDGSKVTVEYGILFALIGLLMASSVFFTRSHHGAYSATAVPASVSIAEDGWTADHPFAETHYRIRDLSGLWALNRETVRQMVKDDPDVVKIRQGRKQAHTAYSIPASAARRIHSRFWGLESAFDEQHYRIADLAARWAVGRETVRLMIKDEPGVLKLRVGRKKAHTTYSVPAAVAKRIHTRLLYAA